VASQLTELPAVLRCGVARGTVYSVGDGNDFFGACITLAARLQWLSGVTFSFHQRGFNLEGVDRHDWLKREIILTRVAIPGFDRRELIALLKTEWEALSPAQKPQFQPV
jgi:hypothetical protein